jgi:ABC-2 type transport system permease protein
MWILVVCAAFVVVKVDNLSYLFASIYDAARWPSSVFRGVTSLVFTFVIPLSVMTTYPALAILGRLEASRGIMALGLSAASLGIARLVWTYSVAKYTSAGG